MVRRPQAVKTVVQSRKFLSVIIACYKDAQAIPVMYERLSKVLQSLPISYEIIFVNDGSPDDSETVLLKLSEKDPHVTVINHSRNFSSQMAFTSGLAVCTSDAAILMDGDLQDPPELIPQFFEQWLQGYDVVYGIRVRRDESPLLQVCYKLFYRIFKLMSYVAVPLDAGDFSLLDRKVINELHRLPERDRFIRGLRAWVGFKQTGVPYVRPKRLFGTSTNSLWKNFRWAIKGIFAFSDVPLQMITQLSLLVFMFSVIGIVYQIFYKLLHPASTANGITTVLIVVLFLGSVQLLVLSILGEYLGKIFEEVKQRPHFIVKSMFRQPQQKKSQPKR